MLRMGSFQCAGWNVRLPSTTRGSRPMAAAAYCKVLSLKSKLLAQMEARSKGSVGPFWPLRLHFLLARPNYCVGLVLTKVFAWHGLWCMYQGPKTTFEYCRPDALMPRQFIVHLHPLSLSYCEHLLFLSHAASFYFLLAVHQLQGSCINSIFRQ